jgi:hypothetical protein
MGRFGLDPAGLDVAVAVALIIATTINLIAGLGK